MAWVLAISRSAARFEAAPLSWALWRHCIYGGNVSAAMMAMMARAIASSNAVSPDSLYCNVILPPMAEHCHFKTCAMLISRFSIKIDQKALIDISFWNIL